MLPDTCMTQPIEQQYQDRGFQLVVYANRNADSLSRCKTCQRPLFHVASTFEERGEQQSLTVHYHYCKKCQHIRHKQIREIFADTSTQEQYQVGKPTLFLVELVAGIRYQAGRGVSLLTVNRHWWRPRLYRLVGGKLLEANAPRVRPLHHYSTSDSGRIVDETAQRVMPMPRYTPMPETAYNPFTSRRRGNEKSEILTEDESAIEESTAINNEEIVSPDGQSVDDSDTEDT